MYALIGRLAYFLGLPVIRLLIHNSRRVRVIIRSGDQVVLVKNWIGSQEWTLPGGGMHKGESREDAALREIHEELKLTLDKSALLFFREIPESPTGLRYTAICFSVELPEAVQLTPDKMEILQAKWFNIANLPDDISPLIRTVFGLKN